MDTHIGTKISGSKYRDCQFFRVYMSDAGKYVLALGAQ